MRLIHHRSTKSPAAIKTNMPITPPTAAPAETALSPPSFAVAACVAAPVSASDEMERLVLLDPMTRVLPRSEVAAGDVDDVAELEMFMVGTSIGTTVPFELALMVCTATVAVILDEAVWSSIADEGMAGPTGLSVSTLTFS